MNHPRRLTMHHPTDTIHHEGESYRISYDEWLECGDCGERWEATTERETVGGIRTEPHGDTTCPGCESGSGHAYIKRAHYYSKYSAIPLKDPPLAVESHAAALRRLANEFEALEANGWNIVESDGIHIFFEKVELDSTDSDYQVSGPLE